MPSTIWTRAELSSSRQKLSGLCWRIVEQHHVSTLKMLDTLDEQRSLERLALTLSQPTRALLF
jgi:hypothetical protein